MQVLPAHIAATNPWSQVCHTVRSSSLYLQKITFHHSLLRVPRNAHVHILSTACLQAAVGMRLEVAAVSRAGQEPGFRKTNQDNCLAFEKYITPDQALFGAMDGHGPHGESRRVNAPEPKMTDCNAAIAVAATRVAAAATGQVMSLPWGKPREVMAAIGCSGNC